MIVKSKLGGAHKKCNVISIIPESALEPVWAPSDIHQYIVTISNLLIRREHKRTSSMNGISMDAKRNRRSRVFLSSAALIFRWLVFYELAWREYQMTHQLNPSSVRAAAVDSRCAREIVQFLLALRAREIFKCIAFFLSRTSRSLNEFNVFTRVRLVPNGKAKM